MDANCTRRAHSECGCCSNVAHTCATFSSPNPGRFGIPTRILAVVIHNHSEIVRTSPDSELTDASGEPRAGTVRDHPMSAELASPPSAARERTSYRYYDLIMAGFVTVLLCSNLIGPGKSCRI